VFDFYPSGVEKADNQARVRVLVSGIVQGVFYRMFVLREAGRLALVGTVRNLLGGRVEVVAEGCREKLEELLAKLRIGPPRAEVLEMAVEWEPFEHEFDDFSIRYG